MLKKYLLLTAVFALLLATPVLSAFTFGDSEGNLGIVAGQAGAEEKDITAIGGRVVKTALLVTGLLFFGFTFYAGYAWMMAQGNEETIKKAQKTLIGSIIGLFIIAGSYGITSFVVTNLIKGEGGTNGETPKAKPNDPMVCCLDWVATGKSLLDQLGLSIGIAACRVTTEDDCEFQGKTDSQYDKLSCPEAKEGCWIFEDINLKYAQWEEMNSSERDKHIQTCQEKCGG